MRKLPDLPPAKMLDEQASYATNEVTINGNARWFSCSRAL